MREVEHKLREKHRREHVQVFGKDPTAEILEECVRFSLKKPGPEDLVTMFDMIAGPLGKPLSEDSEARVCEAVLRYVPVLPLDPAHRGHF